MTIPCDASRIQLGYEERPFEADLARRGQGTGR
jgi:hypothetical protein